MKISELISEDCIIDELGGSTKLEVLQEFSGLLENNGRIKDKEDLTRILVARESLGSTGIGDGVAIPHGKIRGLKRLVLAFGRSSKGVDFDSLDGAPAYLFFLLVAPEDSPGEHLKALARISRLMKNSSLRDALKKAGSAQRIKDILSSGEEG